MSHEDIVELPDLEHTIAHRDRKAAWVQLAHELRKAWGYYDGNPYCEKVRHLP